MLLNDTQLFIGTNGYNHDDWKGTFAPKNINSYDLLTYYANSGLNFLEIAFTFYRIPEVDKIENILKRTDGKIKFSVRLPKQLIKDPTDIETYTNFMKGLAPMIDSELLVAVFADYHPTFSVSKKNMDKMKELRSLFKVPFFVELFNRTWYKDRIFSELKDADIGLTVIDMPQIKGFAPYYPINTNNCIYYKLYGKNSSWITADFKILQYDYSDKEIKTFIKDIGSKTVTASSIFVSFANLTDGFAPKNALKMQSILKNMSKH